MSGVKLQKTGWLYLDVEAIADVVSAGAVGHVLDRQHDGLDNQDKPFRKYSASYAAALARAGESTDVDHRVSGLMLSQLKELNRTRSAEGVVTLTIGVGPGGDRNLIAAYLQRLRPWLGISPRGRASINKAIAKAKKLIKSKRGTSTVKV